MQVGRDPTSLLDIHMEKETWILRKAPDCASFRMAKVTNGKDLDGTSNTKCRAPKFLVDPLEGPSMRQCGSGWNLGHDPDF